MNVPDMIAHLAPQGVQIHIVPVAAGHQVSVCSGHSSNSWTVHTAPSVDYALQRALQQRIAAHAPTAALPMVPAAGEEDLIG